MSADVARPSVLFVDQSGELGGAELWLLDLITQRVAGPDPASDLAVLLSDGPFAARLRDEGADVTVLPLKADVGKHSGLLRAAAAAPRVAEAAARLVRLARRCDVLYANTQKAAIVGGLAAALARKPLVWHLHDILDAEHFSLANRRAVVAATNRLARHVIANSRATAEAYERAGGRVPTAVVYNGIDPERFGGYASTRRPVGLDSVPSGAPLVGLFGRLTPWKGQHVLLDALTAPGMEAWHAAISGEALFTAEDESYADRLRARSNEPPLAGRVHWLGHREDVPALMVACDAIAHCSTQPEPFGRVIVEGQLTGRPVVASAAGGALEIIQDGENGYLVAPGDAPALANTLTRVLANPEEAGRLAEAGQESALQRFRLDDRIAEVNAIIDAVVYR